MKALTQTIIVFVAVNLMTAGFALAQNTLDEGSRDTLTAQAKEADLARKEAEIAAKVAREEAEIAAGVQKQLEAARKQREAAQKEMQTLMMQLRDAQMQVAQEQVEITSQIPIIETRATSGVSIPVWQHSGGGAVLIIPAAEMKVENLATITEDMSVMSRIFDKKLSQARLTTGGSRSIVFDSRFFGQSRSSGAIEAIYLEDYGALFLMKVNLLLSPPPESLEEKKPEEEDTDPLWTQMRQEMYAPQGAEARRRRTDRPEEKYDAERVENLKETLIKTLKHAANIRALKPDESVILTVIGKVSQSGPLVTRIYSSIMRNEGKYVVTEPGAATGSLSPTVLTIRAKKSDIDAFAEGQLSFDQFHQKTQLLSYPYLGGNIGGLSPLLPRQERAL